MNLTVSKLPSKAIITLSCVFLFSACSESKAPSTDIEVSTSAKKSSHSVKADVIEVVPKVVKTTEAIDAAPSKKEAKKTIAENVNEAKAVITESSSKVTEIAKDAAAKVLTNGKAIVNELSESAAQKVQGSAGVVEETLQRAAVVGGEVTEKLSENIDKVMATSAAIKGKNLVKEGAQSAKEAGKNALDQVKSLLPAN
jgi:DeoR/GlpR family transcriptional regulator of sugar metabolism